MKRKHFFVPNEFVRPERYTSPSAGGGESEEKLPERDRIAHANHLLNDLWQIAAQRPAIMAARQDAGLLKVDGGFYIKYSGARGFDLPIDSLARERSSIVLLNAGNTESGDVATVFVPFQKLPIIEKIVSAYRDEDRGDKPKNAKLVASIDSIVLAQVDALWTDDYDALPIDPREEFWAEIWLRTDGVQQAVEDEIRLFKLVGLELGKGEVEFPERRVMPIYGSREQFGRAMLLVNSIAELRRAKDSAAFFHAEGATSQEQWVASLAERLLPASQESPPSICLLDTGVNDHPLLRATLAANGKHTNDPNWGVDDRDGHGTNMAGLCMFGDLSDALLTTGPFAVEHELESVKVLRYGGDNVGRLLGDITREGVARAEIPSPHRRRAFVMPLSSTDTRSRGRPSTWSAMVDKLASGADDEAARLFVVAAGNISRDKWPDYPNANTLEAIHDPGQSWNALTVGAYTEKNDLSAALYPGWNIVAPKGDLGPSSCTSATWNGWPLKPDIVMEGGNAARDPAGSVDTVPSLAGC